MREKKKRGNKIKKIISKLHLWLGLLIGFIIFFISITGSLYVFKDEIQNIQRKEYIYHSEPNIKNKKKLNIRVLEKIIDRQVKEKYSIHWVNIPIDRSMSYQFYWYEHNPKGWNYFNEYPIYKSAYVNPYNGRVLKIYDEKYNFFSIVKALHWGFLLNSEWGKWLTGIPVIIFIVTLVSGIILWWPKNKAARKQRFWFQWKNIKSWKRKNYDLHSILGFYSSIFSLIFALTGLFYAFFIIQAMVYFVFSDGETKYPDFSHIINKAPIEMRTDTTLDMIINKVEKLYPRSFMFSVDLGHKHIDDHEHPNFSIYVRELSYSYHKNNNLIFDENSGELLHKWEHKNKNLGEKVINANYDIHVGSIFGFPTKILAIIASLMCASLPVTGFLIWLGRKRKRY